ncbi:MAG: iron-containing alcohol dehydrogenase [Desulfobacterales bacterium]|jgi:alcohol dehydrogenase|nr:iron-containing alcohol dehydrogenase [Desulfobacterales bacterium]MDP6808508.1 iron-containing alcohol dehydrogenase [Desulfobacterales bacterium]
MYSIVQPKSLYMGPGALSQINRVIEVIEPRRILLVSGPTIEKMGLVDRILQAMGSYRSRAEIFINPKPEPDIAIVEDCAEQVREIKTDLIVGLGGGSPMDVAKGAAVVAAHEEGMRPLLGKNLLRKKGIPVILVPTTAGSGTEATQAVVVEVPEEQTKKSIWDPRTMAEAAIVDPELTFDMPPRLTAETGLDALLHAVEGYTSRGANPMNRLYALEAIQLIGKYLIKAYQRGWDLEAREAMARAATLAGIACSNGGLGAIHALALALDSLDGFTHCQSLAVLAPWVIRFNSIGNEAVYADIARALGENLEGLSAEKASLKTSEAFVRLFEQVGLSHYLKDYGIKKRELKTLALKAYRVGQRLIHMNIREVSEEQAISLFQKAYGEK